MYTMEIWYYKNHTGKDFFSYSLIHSQIFCNSFNFCITLLRYINDDDDDNFWTFKYFLQHPFLTPNFMLHIGLEQLILGKMCGLFSSKYGKFAVKNVAVFENI